MAFRFDQLTLKSQEAVQQAQTVARDRGNQRIEPMHLLAALSAPRPAGREIPAGTAGRQSRSDTEGRRGGAQCPSQGHWRRDDDQS